MPITSLIKADNQLPLFESDQMDPAFFAAEESGATPEFTGARLFANNPDTYRAIVALSAEGLGAMRIGKILHVSPNTVQAVRAREPESIDIEKRRLAGLSREGARMCAEGILEMLCNTDQVKKMNIKDLGIVFGILIEKSELLSGSPTARLQTLGSPVVEIGEYLKNVKILYELKNNAHSIGLREEKEGQRVPALADAGPGEGPKVIEAEVLETPALTEKDPNEDQGPQEIVDPGAKCSVGQTTHRQDDKPVNIDWNEGAQKATGLIIPSDLDTCEASA